MKRGLESEEGEEKEISEEVSDLEPAARRSFVHFSPTVEVESEVGASCGIH